MRIQDLSSGIFSRSVVLVLLTFLPFSRGWAQDLDHQRPTAVARIDGCVGLDVDHGLVGIGLACD